MIAGTAAVEPRSRGCGNAAAYRRTGFTLVEILIVIIIIGILATIVVPQFTNASHQARESTLRDDLRFMRTQIGVYRVQHHDVSPGYPGGNTAASPTEADFIDQMTRYTDQVGNTNNASTPVFKYGPYLSRIPRNPLNGWDTIRVLGDADPIPAADDLTGWFYKPSTQQFIANSIGTDANGTAYSSY